MNCEQCKNLMDGYLDRELDPITNQEIEQHLRDCRNCDGAPYYKASATLRERIQSSLRQEIAKEPVRNVVEDSPSLFSARPRWTRTVSFGTPWSRLALAAAIVFAAVIAFNLMSRLQRPGNDQFLATQLIASHARSLMANHLTDVASSDQHTVKPWLDAKLDFAPPVVDLSSEGFPLIG